MTQNKNESPYASKIWLKSYDDHVKPELEFTIKSIDQAFKETARKLPNSLCYDFQGSCATYQEAEKYVNSFATFLVENGIKKGDTVALNLPNTPQYIIALFGTFYAGCASTGINFLLSAKEVIYQLKDSEAKVIVTMDSFYEEKVREAVASGKTDVKIVVTTNVADLIDLDPKMKEQLINIGKIPFGKVEPVEGIKYLTFNDILANYKGDKSPDVTINPEEDVLLLQYTGGTTGPPKGAILTHRNLSCMLQIVENWFGPAVNPGDYYISGFPFFHLAGMQFCIQSVFTGAGQILVADPRDTAYIANKMKEHQGKITLMYNVSTLYIMLMSNRKFKKLDFSAINGFISGAAPFPSQAIIEYEELVGKGKLIEAYGMTEASPGVTMNPFLGPKKVGTVGVPFPSTEVKLVDVTDREKEVPIGEAGEIAIRGPQIFKGYWKKPEETKNALVDGWFYSGDVGIMDEDGYVTIVDRTKDMIIVGGYKVFSVEVDDKMNKHPAIELASTVGVPNPDRPGSEFVKLYVLLKKGFEASEETKNDILSYAKDNLANYKIPKYIEFVKEMPLTSVGKVDKKILRKI